MSQSEQSDTRGRCRLEMEAFHGGVQMVILADAIDRLAADVAEVKEMTLEIALRVPSEFGQDACDVAVRAALKGRDAAIRERDEARAIAADVAAIKAKVDAVSPDDVSHFVDSEKAWVKLVEEQRDAAIRDRDEARAEAERLQAEQQQPPAAPQPAAPAAAYYLVTNERDMPIHVSRMHPGVGWGGCTITALYAHPQPAGHGISPGLPETQLAGNAAPAAGWLTDEERRVLQDHARSLREQRRSMERAQTLGSSANPATIKREADLIDDILARAGSPPVVEVPPVFQRSSLGDKLVAMQQVKDAMDAAGVSWREVPRD